MPATETKNAKKSEKSEKDIYRNSYKVTNGVGGGGRRLLDVKNVKMNFVNLTPRVEGVVMKLAKGHADPSDKVVE